MPTRWSLYLVRYVNLEEGTFHEKDEVSDSSLEVLKRSEEKGTHQILSITLIGSGGIGGKKIFNRKLQKTLI